MALLSISASARASGKDRNTIKRYLKNGRLSSTKDASGNPVIDTTELMRVFGPLASDGATDAQGQAPASAPENIAVHQLTLETLVKQLEAAQQREKAALEREEWLKGQLEAEQERSRELERKMLPPGEPGEATKGFFRRIFSG